MSSCLHCVFALLCVFIGDISVCLSFCVYVSGCSFVCLCVDMFLYACLFHPQADLISVGAWITEPQIPLESNMSNRAKNEALLRTFYERLISGLGKPMLGWLAGVHLFLWL
jgi:hypothetical protein